MKNIVAISLIAMASIVPYLASLGGDFVWDDSDLIQNNEVISQVGNPGQLLDRPFGPSNPGLTTGYYRPVSSLSFWMNSALSDSLSPSSFRITNIILHTLASLLLYVLLLLIVDSKEALIGALIFSVHPMHAANVAWISGRQDILCAIFMFLSLILYVRGIQENRRKKLLHLLSLLSFVLALGSKELAAVYPGVVLILMFYRADWNLRRTWNELQIGYMTAGIVILAIYIFIHQSITVGTGQAVSFSERGFEITRILANTAYYVYHICAPLTQLDVEFAVPDLMHTTRYLIALGLAVILAALSITFRWNRVSLAFLWLGIFIIPVSGMIPVQSNYSAAAHLGYLAVGAISIAAGQVVTYVRGRWRKNQNLRGAALVIVISVLAVAAYMHSRHWENETALFTHLSEVGGSSYAAALLGDSYWKGGDVEKSEQAYRLALQRDQAEVVAWFGLGRMEASRNNLWLAELYLKNSLQKPGPTNSSSYNNLGNIHYLRRQYRKAYELYQKSLESNPYNYEAMYNAGQTAVILHQVRDAARFLGNFIDNAPSEYDEQKNRARLQLMKHRTSNTL